jgi:hypothetical protein
MLEMMIDAGVFDEKEIPETLQKYTRYMDEDHIQLIQIEK